MIPLQPHPQLPVELEIHRISASLRENNTLCLSAEPGAGKSTVVPLGLLDVFSGKIIMLEPRRIAARASASRMAFLLGEKVGSTVGFRTGLETVCGKNTRIEVVTEAVLTRMIQRDPELPGVDVVIFDEFHERSIHADLGLALALDVRENLRPDLKLLIMSATLDLPSLKKLIPAAAEIHVPGRMFPVRTLYSDEHPGLPLEQRVAFTVRNALNAFPGDALVFLPGEAEIHRTQSALDSPFPYPVEILPLYGNMPSASQDRVFAPKSDPGTRRVILATAIAETSLTVEGVRIVIDSGLMRIPRFSPANGMDRLETIRVSSASAEQRRGRAGRTSDGVCIRLWSEFEERGFEAHRPPEIMETDLCELMLELLNWGVSPESAFDFPFPDPPPYAHLTQACSVLQGLGAVSGTHAISPHGKKLLDLPVHPRLAHMILQSGAARENAILIAALLSERDPVREVGTADLSLRLDTLKNSSHFHCDPAVKSRILQTSDRLKNALSGWKSASDKVPEPGLLLAFAYPDRIARRRPDERHVYTLANGITAELDPRDDLSRSEFLAVGETSTMHGKTKIRLAAPLDRNDLENELSDRIVDRFETNWDSNAECVRCERIRAVGSLVLDRKLVTDPPDDVLLAAYLDGIRKTGFSALDLSKNELAFCRRVTFLHRNGFEADYPDFSENALMDSLDSWLAPFVSGFKRIDQLRKLDFRMILESALGRKALSALRELAPEKIEVPSGSRITVDYSDPAQPCISVRLQEIFGMRSTPRLAGGRVPVLIDVLSPAMRTVQKTQDLESFWRESYFLVRKDMRGRYPKHDWPEDPTNVPAHRGVKRPKTD